MPRPDRLLMDSHYVEIVVRIALIVFTLAAIAAILLM